MGNIADLVQMRPGYLLAVSRLDDTHCTFGMVLIEGISLYDYSLEAFTDRVNVKKPRTAKGVNDYNCIMRAKNDYILMGNGFHVNVFAADIETKRLDKGFKHISEIPVNQVAHGALFKPRALFISDSKKYGLLEVYKESSGRQGNSYVEENIEIGATHVFFVPKVAHTGKYLSSKAVLDSVLQEHDLQGLVKAYSAPDLIFSYAFMEKDGSEIIRVSTG